MITACLKDFRLKYNFSQQRMADYVKTTRGHVAMAEQGERRLPARCRAKFLRQIQVIQLLPLSSVVIIYW